MLGRQAAQKAIDDRRLEAVGFAVTHELSNAVENEPACGIAAGQEIRFAEILFERPHRTDRLFGEYALNHESTLYGEVSENFLGLVTERMGSAPAVFSFVQGLDRPDAV